ncbi:MAG: hypothetical protein ACLFTK_07505 [Anaerolineales bacterium]
MSTYDPAQDLRTLRLMVNHFEPYIYEQPIYGGLGANQPRLTIGGILLRVHRLDELQRDLPTEQRGTFQMAKMAFAAKRNTWKLHYRDKLFREMRARLAQMETYLEDAADDLEAAEADYPPEAVRRTMLQHLMDEAHTQDVNTNGLNHRLEYIDRALDHLLHDEPDDFLWSDDLRRAYPAEDYWWLYRTPADNQQPHYMPT